MSQPSQQGPCEFQAVVLRQSQPCRPKMSSLTCRSPSTTQTISRSEWATAAAACLPTPAQELSGDRTLCRVRRAYTCFPLSVLVAGCRRGSTSIQRVGSVHPLSVVEPSPNCRRSDPLCFVLPDTWQPIARCQSHESVPSGNDSFAMQMPTKWTRNTNLRAPATGTAPGYVRTFSFSLTASKRPAQALAFAREIAWAAP